MFGMIARITVTPGKRDDLLEILAPNEGSLPGCLSYIVARDAKDENVIYITEAWETREAHDASLQLPEVREAVAKGRALIARFDVVAETEPVDGVGLGLDFDNP